ncbi:UNVERIFIED_CONTAM: hypothetical protein GTU68_019886 [Idotea baltica]|nr:hypothetical protein [Idotea baltica]
MQSICTEENYPAYSEWRETSKYSHDSDSIRNASGRSHHQEAAPRLLGNRSENNS